MLTDEYFPKKNATLHAKCNPFSLLNKVLIRNKEHQGTTYQFPDPTMHTFTLSEAIGLFCINLKKKLKFINQNKIAKTKIFLLKLYNFARISDSVPCCVIERCTQ